LARAGIYESDIILVYISVIRSVLNMLARGFNITQSNEIERVHKRCLKMIFPELTYTEALISGLDTLQARRENITGDLFREIKVESFMCSYPNKKLHPLLSENRIHIKSQ